MPAFDLSAARSLCEKRGVFPGARVEYVATTGSTNDDVLSWASSGAPQGVALVADEQTAGRGRHGARWFAPAGDNLTFSVLLRPKLRAQDCTVLPLVAGLAVREALAPRVAAPVTLKWPNDVWVDEKKVAGILVESVMRAELVSAAVVGIGINVETREFPSELVRAATSLALAGAERLDRAELFVDVLASLERRVADLVRSGFAEQLEELNRFDGLAGRRVRVDDVRGIARGIGDGGVLWVDTEQGRVSCVSGGVVLDD